MACKRHATQVVQPIFFADLLNSFHSRFVAVKLLPRATAIRESENEINILQHIQAQAEKIQHIRRFLGRFIEDRGEKYDGIVLEVTGQSVQSKLSRDSISFSQKKKIIHDCMLRPKDVEIPRPLQHASRHAVQPLQILEIQRC
jgi:hypothetical protein